MSNTVAPEGATQKTDAEKQLDKHGGNNTLPTKELENGPVKDRSCTDIICCLVFVAFLVGWIAAAGYGISYGDAELLLTPWDADGKGCGYTKGYEDYPLLYFPNIDFQAAAKAASKPSEASVTQILKYGVCVKECPAKTGPVDCKPASFMAKDYKSCVYEVAGVAMRYGTMKAGRFCVPDSKAMEEEIVQQMKEQFNKYFGGMNLQKYLGDIIAAREVLLITLATAFLLGFVYMLVLRLFGGPLIYLSILALFICSLGGGWMLFQQSTKLKETDPNNKQVMYYQVGSYIVWAFALVLLCCVCCNRKNIQIGVAVMKATGQYIGNNPHVFLVPPLASVLLLICFFLELLFMAYITSVGKIGPNPDFPIITTVQWGNETQYVFLYSLFGDLWINAFIIGCTQFIISASVALWYFSSTADDSGHGSFLTGLYWVFRYHLGSIALGSFLIALIQFIRIIFEWYKRQLEKANPNNQVVKVLLCLTSYCLDCIERFIQFITKNAYIQIALTGKNFCQSAWNAFILILKNALRFGTANSIGFIFGVLGVAFIGACNGLIVYAMLHYIPAYSGNANNWIAPAVVGVIEGFIIGRMFMSVFSFASDTILQSFMVDEELKRPDGNRPAVMNDLIEGMSAGDKK